MRETRRNEILGVTRVADGYPDPAQRRRLLIDICRRRIKPGTGSSQALLRGISAVQIWPDLRPILSDLAWVVAGAVATRAYMPERATKDLDILVRQQDGETALDRLQAAGYQLITHLAIPGFALRSPEGREVDLLLGDHPWLDEALAHPARDLAGYPVLDLPYLVLMKLESSRMQDLGDLARMLGLAPAAELARVRAAVSRYAAEATDDLESLIYLGRLELQTPPSE